MNLTKSTEDRLAGSIDRLTEAYTVLLKVKDLPLSLRNLEGDVDLLTSPDSSLIVTHYSDPEGAIKAWEEATAIQFGLWEFSKYSGNWHREGSVEVNGLQVRVTVYGLNNPKCTIEKISEVVPRFKAICSGSGEQINP